MDTTPPLPPPSPIQIIHSILLLDNETPHDIHISSSGYVTSIIPSTSSPSSTDTTGKLALPSLCIPHIHIDKCHLFSHPSTSHLRPKTGTFSEALSLTKEAKPLYTKSNLWERGNWCIAEAARAGVTSMRAFVEVDAVTGMKCLDVGLELKKFWRERVEVQVCLFAQENLFGEEEDGDDGDISENKKIFERALEEKKEGIDVIGSAPYVESSPSLRKQNIRFIVNLAIQYNKILDFHLDYNLNPQEEPLIWYVLEYLKEVDWIGKGNRCVTFGHCTRLTLFSENEWERLKREVGELNVGFVGLPGSDLFMMGRPEHREGQQKESSGQEGSKKGEGEEERKEDEEELRPDNRPRGTLQLLNMYNRGFQCGVAVNNVGNAFTPQGNLDPMSLCSLGVGLYQASTDEDMNILYSFVSSAAKGAIGLESSKEERDGEEDISREGKDMVEDMSIVLKVGRKADIVLFGRSDREAGPFYRRRRTVGDVVCDAGPERVTIYGGRVIKLE